MFRKLEPHLTIIAPALVAFLVYLPILFFQAPVNPDAQIILPLLREMDGIQTYIANLLMLRTVDLQPVRDLSFCIDIFIKDTFGFNSAVLQNLIIWVASISVLDRIIVRIFPRLTNQQRAFILAAFTAYPLFTQTLGWGIARKHLLAFFFSLLATNAWLAKQRRAWIFYFLALLSQPIFILWPIWCYLHSGLNDRTFLRDRWGTLLTSTLVMSFMAWANYFYYEHSPVFLTHYDAKTTEIFEISNKSLALGHYAFQLAFPYLLSFDYSLGHWSTLVGHALIGVALLVLMRSKLERRLRLSFLAFTILPLAVVLTKPTMIYDTYLLLPGVGVLFLILSVAPEFPAMKNSKWLACCLLLFWCCFSMKQVFGWRNEILLTQNGFNNRPSCVSAYQYLRMSYENGVPAEDPDAKLYLAQNECHKERAIGLGIVNLQANMLYYEEDLKPNERLVRLEELANKGIFPNIALAGLYLKFGMKAEADIALRNMQLRFGSKNYKSEYIPIAAQILQPYCQETKNQDCLKQLEPFLKENNF